MIKYYADVDHQRMKVKNANLVAPVFDFGATLPTEPVDKQFFFDTSDEQLKYYDATKKKWIFINNDGAVATVASFTNKDTVRIELGAKADETSYEYGNSQLAFIPNVQVIDSDNNVVHCDIKVDETDTSNPAIVLNFNGTKVTGKAYLS